MLLIKNCPVFGVHYTVLEEKLISYGYHDVHRAKYAETLFLIRSHRAYQVTDSFPRLIAPLPTGVGDLSYTIALSACAQFSRNDNEVIHLISKSTSLYDA